MVSNARNPRKPMRGVRDPRHGTEAGYYYHGCRCDRCTDYCRERSRRRRHENFLKLKPEDHGKSTTYVNADCRCEPCRTAHSALSKARREAKRNTYPSQQQPEHWVALSDLA